MISDNLIYLRKLNHFSQEYVAGSIGVSRQAVAKWENGDTTPDLENSAALAKLYHVTLDNLVNYNPTESQLPIPPKGKYIFGMITVGERGQIVIPKKAREIFSIHSGDNLFVLGDEVQGGLALLKSDIFKALANEILSKGELSYDSDSTDASDKDL